jgi:hypothetical protein
MENEEKYKKEKVTINVYRANIFGVLFLIPTTLIFGVPYYLMWKNEILFQVKDIFIRYHVWSALIIILVLIFGIIAHELIHGIVWAKFTKNGFKSIKFGIIWKMITPYCHSKEPLKVQQYTLGAIMPAIILGFIPVILSIVVGNIALLAFGIIFILSASGDFYVIYTLRNEKKDTLIEDHPSEVGYYVYRLIEEV